MNKILKLSFLSILMFFSLLIARGQYMVQKVTDQSVNTAQEGFFYSLPLTVLKINLVYEKIEKIRGPLSDYTLNYLGTPDYITANSTDYRLIDVNVVPEYTADPNQQFYVQFPSVREKDQKAVSFTLSAIGTLLSFDEAAIISTSQQQPELNQTFVLLEGDKEFDFQAEYNRKKKQDTITRRINIDTVSIDRFIFKTSWVDKSDEDKANEVAMQISRIRESRYNLLTGYQEVNYGESMKYMDSQLQKMENQYLELFLGKEVKSIESQTVYYIPKKETAGDVLLEMGERNQININIRSLNTVSNLPEKPLEKVDHLYYRVPGQATVEIEFDETVFFRKNFTIAQLGVVSTAPINRTKTQFDPQTGSLRRIVRE